MRAGSLFVCVALVAGCASGKESAPTMKPGNMTPMKPQTPDTDPAKAEQLVLVTTTGWDAVTGSLRRFEKKDGAWAALGAPVEVVVGKSGLAIGRGLAPLEVEGPVKKEGDGRAPAGIFAIGAAFGVEDRTFAIGYRKVDEHLECVDDPKSIHYARFAERMKVGVWDWKSSEKMKREDGIYDLGALVGHNTNPIQRGAGSCIFLHIWRGPAQGTAGCTAMERPRLDEVLTWLDPARHPVLVQLPEPVLGKVRGAWGLPEAPRSE